MSAKIMGYVVEEAGKAAELKEIELPEIGDNDVEVEVKFCGVCASDVDAIDGKYGPLPGFPLVAGHEGVGEVVKVGKNVTAVKVGAKVGLGTTRYSCGACGSCSDGKDNLCGEKQLMWMRKAGTGPFGKVVRLNERYAIPIPDGYPLEYAGPLMCAGATVFAPFVEHGITGSHRVGVVGVGGLGHLALQFARAQGCYTTAFSRSDAKRKEAEGFGAHRYVVTSDEAQVSAAKGSQDYIFCTAGGSGVDYNQLLSLLAPNGMIVLMGFTGMQLPPLNMVELISGQKGVKGSAAGSRNTVLKMLRFAAAHDIKPTIELMPFDKINEAFEKVRTGNVRYRCVLQW